MSTITDRTKPSDAAEAHDALGDHGAGAQEATSIKCTELATGITDTGKPIDTEVAKQHVLDSKARSCDRHSGQLDGIGLSCDTKAMQSKKYGS